MQRSSCPYRQLQEQLEEFVPRESPSLKIGKHTHTQGIAKAVNRVCADAKRGTAHLGAGARKSSSSGLLRLAFWQLCAETCNLARHKFQPLLVPPLSYRGINGARIRQRKLQISFTPS